MNDVKVLLGNDVVAHVEKSPDFNFDTRLFAHLAHQGVAERFAFLDPPTGQTPPPRPVGVLVEQENLPILHEEARHSCIHTGTLANGAYQWNRSRRNGTLR